MTSQVQATLIKVPEVFAERIIKLRGEFGWSQFDLHQQTKKLDEDRVGVSLRRIGSLERQEGIRFRSRTLHLIALAFKVSLADLLDSKSIDVRNRWQSPPVKPTHLFSKSLELLYHWVSRCVSTVIIEGNSGIGKSSLLASLVNRLNQKNVVWFDGNRLSQLDETFSQMEQFFPNGYLIVDEDYQVPIRDLNFFVDFLGSSLYLSPNRPNLILSLRHQTYKSLVASNFLSRNCTISLQLTSQDLDNKDAWNIYPSLSEKEKIWIQDQFDREPLNTLLIDNVYIPFIVSRRIDDELTLPITAKEATILTNIYQNLILRQSISDQFFFQALSQSGKLAKFPTLFLITSLLSEKNANITLCESLSYCYKIELVEAQSTPFFEKMPDWSAPTTQRFRFRQNLFQESIDYHHSNNLRLEKSLVAKLCQLIEQEVVDVSTLTESIATFLTLASAHPYCLEQISKSIAKNLEKLLESGQAGLTEVCYIVFSMTWFGGSDLMLEDEDNSNLYDALQTISYPLVKRLQPEHLEELLERNNYDRPIFPLFGWAHTLYKIGSSSREINSSFSWLFSEYHIPILKELGNQIKNVPHGVASTWSRSMRIDYAYLLIWAGDWLTAGNILNQELIDWDPMNEELIPFDFLLILVCYKAAQREDLIQKLLEFHMPRLTERSDLIPLLEYVNSDLELVKRNGVWELQRKALLSNEIKASKSSGVVISGDSQAASRLCQAVRELGYKDWMLMGDLDAEIENFVLLPMKILLVGDVLSRQSLIEKYMTEQQKREFYQQLNYSPYLAQIQFQIGKSQVCWIKGGWNQKTIELANDFVDSNKLRDFCLATL